MESVLRNGRRKPRNILLTIIFKVYTRVNPKLTRVYKGDKIILNVNFIKMRIHLNNMKKTISQINSLDAREGGYGE